MMEMSGGRERSSSEVNLTIPLRRGNTGDMRCVTLLLVVVGVVAIAAVVVAALALTKPQMSNVNVQSGGQSSSSGGQSNQFSQATRNRLTNLLGTRSNDPAQPVWMIAHGHDWNQHEYMTTSGYVDGFSLDIIREVCKAAGINCQTVWDPYSNCWDSVAGQHSRMGKGLAGGWYHACTGWVATTNRISSVTFSQAFVKPQDSYWYTKPNVKFNYNDISNKRIGFLDGWANDEKCLARLKVKGTPMATTNIRHFETSDLLGAAISNGTVDAGFANPDTLLSKMVTKNQLVRLVGAAAYNCYLSGHSMMTRKECDFNHYWNQGFAKIVSNGVYRKICKQALALHGAAVKCY